MCRGLARRNLGAGGKEYRADEEHAPPFPNIFSMQGSPLQTSRDP